LRQKLNANQTNLFLAVKPIKLVICCNEVIGVGFHEISNKLFLIVGLEYLSQVIIDVELGSGIDNRFEFFLKGLERLAL
jgi:hypothetical protein